MQTAVYAWFWFNAYYPEVSKPRVSIDGYADKGTGNPKINQGYAQKRAESVAKALQDKGVPAKQIKVSSHGDEIQPFADNDKNRCVIIVGK